MQSGIAEVSWSSVTPMLRGNGPTRVEQLQEDANCSGSQGPVALDPAPRERRSCQALPYEIEFFTRTGLSIL